MCVVKRMGAGRFYRPRQIAAHACGINHTRTRKCRVRRLRARSVSWTRPKNEHASLEVRP
eukprot:5554110-Prymnesium_polylepis.1